ncbi:unnamed protein product, partial [Allacma fusca]
GLLFPDPLPGDIAGVNFLVALQALQNPFKCLSALTTRKLLGPIV